MKHVCFTRASVCGLCTRVQEHSRAFICIPRRMFYARVDEDSVCVDATIHSAVWRTDMHDKMQWADWIKFFVSVPYLWGGVHRSITSICSHTDSITWLRDIVTVIASVAGLVFEFDNKQQVGVWMFDCDKPHACLLVGFPQQLSLLSNRAETNKTWNTCFYVTHAPILALLRHDFPLSGNCFSLSTKHKIRKYTLSSRYWPTHAESSPKFYKLSSGHRNWMKMHAQLSRHMQTYTQHTWACRCLTHVHACKYIPNAHKRQIHVCRLRMLAVGSLMHMVWCIHSAKGDMVPECGHRCPTHAR
jgi:hypothetical protein